MTIGFPENFPLCNKPEEHSQVAQNFVFNLFSSAVASVFLLLLLGWERLFVMWRRFGPLLRHRSARALFSWITALWVVRFGVSTQPIDSTYYWLLGGAVDRRKQGGGCFGSDALVLLVANQTNARRAEEGEGKTFMVVILYGKSWPGFAGRTVSVSARVWKSFATTIECVLCVCSSNIWVGKYVMLMVLSKFGKNFILVLFQLKKNYGFFFKSEK